MPSTLITIETAQYLGLFDEVKYKYVKDFFDNNDDDDDLIEIEVEAVDDDDDLPTFCKTIFKFEIPFDFGMCDKGTLKVKTTKRYNGSSPFAMKMCEVWDSIEEEEESDEEEEE